MQNSIKVNSKGGTTLNLNILKSFLVTSETKNLTKASELLNYSQSTVSTHIEKLEKQLDVKLFYRKKIWYGTNGRRLSIR